MRKKIIELAFKNAYSILKRFFYVLFFFFSIFGYSQVFVTDSTKFFVDDNTILQGEIKHQQTSISKANIYASDESYITNLDEISNAEIIIINEPSDKKEIKVTNNKGTIQKITKKKKTITPVKTVLSSLKKVESPYNSSHFIQSENNQRVTLIPNYKNKIYINEKIGKIYIKEHFLFYDYFFSTQKIISLKEISLSTRPPPSIV